MRRAHAVLTLWLVVLLGSLVGCLPGDERPQPGELLVQVKRSEDVMAGFVTDDGWTLRFDRFVAALGDVALDGAYCVDYGLSTYHRVYDFAAADTSKVSLHYALGTRCSILFWLRSPGDAAVVMAGVSADDLALMRDPELDVVRGELLPVSLMVVGEAERDGVRKRFRWLIRKEHRISTCFAGGGIVNDVDLEADNPVVYELEIRPRELFRLLPIDRSPVEFGRIAAADRDGDGEVTLAELDEVVVPWGEVLVALNASLPGGSREETSEKDPLMRPAPKESLATLVHGILSGRVLMPAKASDCDAGFYYDFPF